MVMVRCDAQMALEMGITGDYGMEDGRAIWRLQSRGLGTVCDCQQTRKAAFGQRQVMQAARAKKETRSTIHPSAGVKSS
jgi:hypothetical protein